MSIVKLPQPAFLQHNDSLTMFSWTAEMMKQKGEVKMVAHILGFLNGKEWRDEWRLKVEGKIWANWTFTVDEACKLIGGKAKALKVAVLLMRANLLLKTAKFPSVSACLAKGMPVDRFEAITRAVLSKDLSIIRRWMRRHEAQVKASCVRSLKELDHLKRVEPSQRSLARPIYEVSGALAKELELRHVAVVCKRLKEGKAFPMPLLRYQGWVFCEEMHSGLTSYQKLRSVEDEAVRFSIFIGTKAETHNPKILMQILECTRPTYEWGDSPEGLQKFREDALSHLSAKVKPNKYLKLMECLTEKERFIFLEEQLQAAPDAVNPLIQTVGVKHLRAYFFHKGDLKKDCGGILRISEDLAKVLNSDSSRKLTKGIEKKCLAVRLGNATPVPWSLLTERMKDPKADLSGMKHWNEPRSYKHSSGLEGALAEGKKVFQFLQAYCDIPGYEGWMDSWRRQRAEILAKAKAKACETGIFQKWGPSLLGEEMDELREEYYRDHMEEIVRDLRESLTSRGLRKVLEDQGLLIREEIVDTGIEGPNPTSYLGIDLTGWKQSPELDIEQVRNLIDRGLFAFFRYPGVSYPISLIHLHYLGSMEELKADSEVTLAGRSYPYSSVFLGKVAPQLLAALQEGVSVDIRDEVLAQMIQMCYFPNSPYPEGVGDVEVAEACVELGLDGSQVISLGLRSRYWKALRAQYKVWKEEALRPELVVDLLGSSDAFAQVPWRHGDDLPILPLAIAAWMGDPLFLTHMQKCWEVQGASEEQVAEAWKDLDRAYYPLDRAYLRIPKNLFDRSLPSRGRAGFKAKLQGVFRRSKKRSLNPRPFRKQCLKAWLDRDAVEQK